MPAPPPAPVEPTLDGLAIALGELRDWAGRPSYSTLAQRVRRDRAARGRPAAEQSVGRVTVYDCFRLGRRRMDVDLVTELVRVLGAPDVAAWRRAVIAAGAAPERSRLVLVRQGLPTGAAPFVGRDSELAATTATRSRVVEVVGMAGIGKTAFVVAAAEALAPPGGCWYVDLRGFDPRLPPADPGAVVTELVRRLRPAQRPDADDRVLLGEALEERGALLVLDNVADADQVAAVLPARGRVLVSSRRRLSLPGAHLQELAPLDPAGSLGLLSGVVGGRLDADPPAARRIAELCGGVPLQLVVAAGQIAGHPDWSIDDLARRMSRVRPERGISSALQLSFDQLPQREQGLLRLLALHPGPEVRAPAVAALAGVDHEVAVEALARLRTEHLVLPTGSGDRLHDLVREFALGQLEAATPWSEQEAARQRLVQHHLSAGVDGDELPAMVAVAASYDLSDPVCRLAQEAGHRLLDLGLLPAAVELIERAARSGDEQVSQAARHDLSRAHELAGRFDDAMLALRSGNDSTTPLGLNLMGNLAFRAGRYDEALGLYTRSLAAAREVGDPVRIGRALANVANAHRMLGRLEEAERRFAEALEATTAAGDEATVGHVLANSGLLAHTAGDLDRALDRISRGIDMARRHGWQADLCARLAFLGQVRIDRGDLDEAEALANEALELVEQTDARLFAGDVHDILGRVALARGRHDVCRGWHERAMAVGEEMQVPLHLLNAHNGLGELCLATARPGEAAEHFSRALGLAESAGAPYDVERSRRGLAACETSPGAGL